jgi:hypothetical protein
MAIAYCKADQTGGSGDQAGGETEVAFGGRGEVLKAGLAADD